MSHVLLFSFTAMANPTLLAATTVMLLLPNPKRLMLGYLIGAVAVSVTLGILIVLEFKDSGLIGTAKHTLNPSADFVVGGILLTVAFVVGTRRTAPLDRRRADRRARRTESPPPRWQQALAGGSPRVTVLVGAALTLPGASYLAALTSVIKLKPSAAEAVVLVLLINVIMLALIELPLLGFAVAPDWTTRTIAKAKDWFSRNGRNATVAVAATLGTLLIARGVVTL